MCSILLYYGCLLGLKHLSAHQLRAEVLSLRKSLPCISWETGWLLVLFFQHSHHVTKVILIIFMVSWLKQASPYEKIFMVSWLKHASPALPLHAPLYALLYGVGEWVIKLFFFDNLMILFYINSSTFPLALASAGLYLLFMIILLSWPLTLFCVHRHGHQEVEGLYRQALVVRESCFGSSHIKVAEVLVELGESLSILTD